MKTKINTDILTVFGVVVLMLYCLFRTLSTLAVGPGGVTQLKTDSPQGNIEFLLQDLEKSIIVEADTLSGCSLPRDPMVPGKPGQNSSSTSALLASAIRRSVSKPRIKVTGLVLDQKDPVAIVEIDGVSREVKVGSALEGSDVIRIDQDGVHIMKDGNIVTIN